MRTSHHNKFIAVLAIAAMLLAAACANRGMGPQGGPKDTTPPVLLKSTPKSNATEVSSQILELQFDEIVQVESPFEKVVISPPQSTPPVIKALGHKVKVELKDSLIDSTTYTIDFTDAIVDNNERNSLTGLSLGFSTGDHIDTLRMCGTVVDAETLNPVGGIFIGIHGLLHDSAFTTTPFRRISKTNADGQFCISNIAHGSYRIYALADMGNNYLFDLPTERIAFNDSVYTPTATVNTAYDTIGHYYTDTITGIIDSSQFIIDSVNTRYYSTFAPADILLQSFIEKDRRHYMVRSERKAPHNFSLMFSSPCDTLPQIRPLNVADSAFSYLLQKNATVDTLTYWLTDTNTIAIDTLVCQLSYFRTDIDSQYVDIDTISLVYRRPKTNPKKPQTAAVKSNSINHNASAKFDIFMPLNIELTTPSRINDTCHYSLQLKNDTIYTPEAKLIQTDSIGLKYQIKYDWAPETSYSLTLDSAFFIALDGSVSQKQELNLTVKSLEEYGKIIFSIKDYRNCEVIQILDKSDKIVRQVSTSVAKTTIEYLAPGTYYARLFLDRNHNGKWDTGSCSDHRQAEEVYYFPYEIELRAFWDVEEEWDINELPLIEQKPAVLIKKDQK